MDSGLPAWTDADLRDPHQTPDKARRVREMFAAIAPSYDLNNRLHSLWRDQAWRRAAVRVANLAGGERVLDVACGTGDLALAFRDALKKLEVRGGKLGGGTGVSPVESGTGVSPVEAANTSWTKDHPNRRDACSTTAGTGCVAGVDFTHDMLRVAAAKSLDEADHRDIGWLCGDAMRLPAADASADVVSIAFGIRNVTDPAAAVREFHRVLKPGGRLIVLEFSLPRNRVLRGLYNFYFRHILPRTASLIARDRSGAYKYLPQSVNTFINRETLQAMMTDAGFVDVTARPLTFGVAVIYRGVKRAG